MKFCYKVSKNNKYKRLDTYLAYRLSGYTRSSIKKIILNGDVKINSKVTTKCSKSVILGDIIKIDISERSGNRELEPRKMNIDIVYKDRDILVVNKASGIPVHPGCGNYDNTLLNGLIYRYKKIMRIGKPYRLGLVHRIDKETSGLVLVALNDYALWFLSRQFENRYVVKLYIAVVKGDIRRLFKQKKVLCISNYIARSMKNRKKMAVVKKEKGKIATTYFYMIGYKDDKGLEGASIVIAKPKTGRTHQIRVQLSHLGYNIIGDKIYGCKEYSRMLLHAYAIRIRMLNGESKCFRADIPDDFIPFLGKNEVIKKTNKLLC